MHSAEERRRRLLARYEEAPVDARSTGRRFTGLWSVSQLLLIGLTALTVATVEPTPAFRSGDTPPTRFTFQPERERPSAPPEAEPEPDPEPREEEIPEITPETVLDQAIDRPADEPEQIAPPADEPQAPPPPRRVYGVRKVYARGLGSGAGSGSGIVVKRGNTLDGVADTVVALPEDLQGTLAPLSTVNRAPEPTHRVKPKYSETLRENRATGTVAARLLVDIDGTVRAVEIVADIGFDSRELAVTAFRQFRFRPALRAGEPVAVWIVHKIRFEFQE